MNYNKSKYPMITYTFYDFLILFKNMFRKYPVSSKYTSCTPFFIIGSGRSGNTLLRSILCNHPDISIPPESYVLKNVIRKYNSLYFLSWEDIVKIILGEFESHKEFYTWDIDLQPLYEKLTNLDNNKRALSIIIDEIYIYYASKKFSNAIIWGDKTPINTLYLGWINRLFPNAKFIHIIRDGRDVVSSYLKMGRYDNIEDASNRWTDSIRLAKNFGKSLDKNRYYEIYYEDLVTNPDDEIKKLCNYLNLQYKNDILKHFTNFDQLGDVDKLEHHKNIQKPINTKSIGKWKFNLNQNQKQYLEKKLNNYLKNLNYL